MLNHTGEREKARKRNRRRGDQEVFGYAGGKKIRRFFGLTGDPGQEWRCAGLRPAYGDHEIRKNKQLAIECCLFFRIS